jgi:hypothetical protein
MFLRQPACRDHLVAVDDRSEGPEGEVSTGYFWDSHRVSVEHGQSYVTPVLTGSKAEPLEEAWSPAEDEVTLGDIG